MENEFSRNAARKRNIVKIRSVIGDVNQIYIIQPCMNPETRRYPDCVRSVDKNGDMILSEEDKTAQSRGAVFIPVDMMIEIHPGQEFDLNKPRDRALWECIEHCPGLAASRSQKDANGDYVIDGNSKRYGIAELYVENEELETERSVNSEKKIFDAKSLIFGDPRDAYGRLMMCKIIGRDMTGSSDSEITQYLLSICDKTPQRIIDLYTGDDLSLRFLFVEAREKNVIRIRNKAYVYGDENQFILGMTDDSVINWMKNPANQRILNMIKQDVNPDLYADLDKGLNGQGKEDENSEELIAQMNASKPQRGRK